jgi:predicted type IV restriction endonuclease
MPDSVPSAILALVERFAMHREAYKSPDYNETQVRREFIDPFFKALGWDVDNEKGYAEQWKEVYHEDAVRIGGVTKAPDYSFRLGGRRLFFLEAKKPAINLREAQGPAFQLRRYAWTAKLPISILTDFEEFIVYDTRVKPAITDKASKARILYMTFEEYAQRWAEIADLFAPEAIRKGALDKYVQSSTQKRGTAEVDDAFLSEIESWREILARNVALRNPGLSQRELNFSVQLLIDRVIFLRICEDRGIEPYGRLRGLLNGENTYPRLRELFDRADKRYNSGLFHFEREKDRPGLPDELTPRLSIDDKVLKDIFRRLYYPDCPYEFSVLPAEILGHVYERFLGSVIRLTEGGRAKVEQKPEVRKAGGVYYTPSYIVEYIVRQTVGELVKDKTPQEAAGMTET